MLKGIVFIDFPYFHNAADWDKKNLKKDSPFNRIEPLCTMFSRVTALNQAPSWTFIITCSNESLSTLLSAISTQLNKKPVLCFWTKPPGSYSGTGNNYVEAVEVIVVIYMGDATRKTLTFARYVKNYNDYNFTKY